MDAHIILTGSTGNLGSYLLDCLLRIPQVAKVICLNRSSDASERQVQNHRARGLVDIVNHPKVEFIQCDLSQPHLGIAPQVYTRLAGTVTHLIHNAWPVSFNLSFSSFEPQIRGVKNLIDFITRCNHYQKPVLFFISSVSVVGRWGTLAGALEKVPEVLIDDWRTAKMGYGQSKLVSERLVAEACDSKDIRGTICRVGQLGGPVRRGEVGKWNTNEWFPSLVKSSEHLGVIPRELGPMDNIDWVPIDVCAEVVVELVLAPRPVPKVGKFVARWKTSQQNTSFYHVANPEVVSYSSLMPVISKCLSPRREVKPVSFIEWVDRLEDSAKVLNTRSSANAPDSQQWQQNPAAKLIPFFDELRDKADRFPRAQAAKLDTTVSQGRSPTLAKLQAINEETMQLWLRQWGYKSDPEDKGD